MIIHMVNVLLVVISCPIIPTCDQDQLIRVINWALFLPLKCANISMESSDVDLYLELENSQGEEVEEGDE